jgi:putative transposase
MDTPGPHRKLVRHYHEPGDLHELTFSCFKRLPLFNNDRWREQLARYIDAAGERAGIQLVAFVFMPEHVHLLVAPMTAKPDIGRYLAWIKQPFSKSIREQLLESNPELLERLMVQERPGKTCFRFWQEGPGYDRNLNTPATIERAIDYLHRNPCRRDLATRAVDWKWSSARWYLLDPPRQQFLDLPHVYGPPVGMLDTN